MKTDFLNNCFEEEQSLYEQLVAVQTAIRAKGGIPKYPITSASSTQPASTENPMSDSVLLGKFNPDWPWIKKTEFAFQKISYKASPSQVISFILENEQDADKGIVANNIYNSISRLVKDGMLAKSKDGSYVMKNEKPRL